MSIVTGAFIHNGFQGRQIDYTDITLIEYVLQNTAMIQ